MSTRKQQINARITALEAALAEAKKVRSAEEKREAAKANQQARRDDTRRKILVGGWLVGKAAKPADLANLRIGDKCFADSLTRDSDRALFGLPPLAAAAQNQAAAPAPYPQDPPFHGG